MTKSLEIGVRDLRNNLSRWLDAVRGGGQIVITERGKPVARLTGMSYTPAMERLVALGALTPARRPKQPADPVGELIKAKGSVAGLVSEQRRR